MDLSDYVNVKDAAKLMKRKESLVRTLCQQGRFTGLTKIGKAWLIPREEVLKYKPRKRGAKPKRSPDRIFLDDMLLKADNLKQEKES